MPRSLPVIDFAGASDEALARQLDQAFTDIGFCYFRDIGVDRALVDGVFAASRRFHAQPRAAKDAIAMNHFHRGYMAPKTSIIETSSVAKVTGRTTRIVHADARGGARRSALWPAARRPEPWPDLPGFREPVEAYETAMRAFCLRLLAPMALALGLPRDWFLPHFVQPTTFLRLLHYPPHARDAPDDAFGSAPHTDYGFVTILAQDRQGRPRGAAQGRHLARGAAARRHVGGQCRRHAVALDQRPLAVDAASGEEPVGRRPILVPVLLRHGDGQHRRGAADLPSPAKHPAVRYGDYLMERLDKNYAYRQQPAA